MPRRSAARNTQAGGETRGTPGGVREPEIPPWLGLPRARVRNLQQVGGFERVLHARGLGPIVGVDEAGRGACAGPMVVAGCVLPPRLPAELSRLTDSKRLSAGVRAELFEVINRRALATRIEVVPAQVIDADGVHRADLDAMRRIINLIAAEVGYSLSDGYPVPGTRVPNLGVISGDLLSSSVAAASVLAKVTRDRIMVDIDSQFPQYGFAVHKGYGTAAHTVALAEHGPCEQHRFSFKNVRSAVKG